MKLTRDSTFDLTSLDLGSCLDLLLRRKLYPIQDNPRPPNTCSCKDEKAALEGDSISSDDAVSFSTVSLQSIQLTRDRVSRAFNFDKWWREKILLYFDSIFLSSSSRSWKTSNTRRGQDLELERSWKLQMDCWERREEGGNCPFVNYHPNWKTVCQPFATSDLQDLIISPIYILYSCSPETTIG